MSKAPALDEKAIRKALCRHPLVCEPRSKGARIIEELGLHKGAVRADLAVVDHNRLTGFEIKSRGDTLKRLPAQVELYSAIFDYCYLVTDCKHLDKALKLLPSWWGVFVVDVDELGLPTFFKVQEAVINLGTDAVTRSQLLWKDEIIAFLKDKGAFDGLTGANADILRYRMVRTLGPTMVKKHVCTALRERIGWRRAFKADVA